MDQRDLSVLPLFDAVFDACKRIRLLDDAPIEVSAVETDGVLPGKIYRLETSKGVFQFWLGINAPRLMFCTLAEGRSQDTTEHAFRYLAASAGSMSWEVLFEPLRDGVTGLVATCVADHRTALVAEIASRSSEQAAVAMLTRHGRYWALETALLVQGWLRTCERYAIRSSQQPPTPL